MDQLEQNHSQLEARLALFQQTSMQLDTEFITDRTSWQQAQKDLRSAKRERLIGALQKQMTSLSLHLAGGTRCQEILIRFCKLNCFILFYLHVQKTIICVLITER
jgi:hypothetical protein